MDLGTLEVNIGADMSGLNRGLRKAQSKIKNATRRIKKAAQGATIALGAIGTAAVAASQHAANYAKEVRNAADVTDTSTDTFQELSYALQQVGARQEDAYEGLIELNRVMGEATKGDKRATEALDTVGISMEQVKDESFSTIDAFMKSVKALNEIESQAVKTDAAAILFSEDVSRRLLPAVEQGADEIQAMMKRAQELGIVMDKEAINAAVKYRDSVKELQQSLGAATRVIGSEFIPIMSQLVDKIKQVTINFVNLPDSTKKAMIQFTGLASAVLGGVAALGLFAIAIETAMAGLSILGSIVGFFASPMVLAAAGIAAAGMLAYKAWNENWGGIRDKLSPIVDTIKEWASIGAEALTKTFSFVFQKGRDAFNTVSEWFTNNYIDGEAFTQWSWIIDVKNRTFEWIDDHIVPVFTTTWNVIVDVAGAGVEFFEKMWQMMGIDPETSGRETISGQVGTTLSPNSATDGSNFQFQYAQGGYTGNMGVGEIAGVVHGQEYVIPADMVKQMPGVVSMLEKKRKGYKNGGMVGGSTPSFAGMNFGDMKGFVDGIKSSISTISDTIIRVFQQLAKVMQKVLNVVGESLGMGKLGDKVSDVIKGFGDLFDATKTNAERTEKNTAAKNNNTETVKDNTNAFMSFLKNEISGIGKKVVKDTMIGDVMKGAQRGAQAAGPQGAAAGAISEVLKNSDQFSEVMEIITKHLQVVANSFGKLLEPLIPLINVIQQTLAPIFQALGSILKALIMPMMKAIFPVLKYLGITISYVALGILKTYNFFARAAENVVNGIIGLINKLPFADLSYVDLTVSTDSLENSIKNLKDTTWDSASTIEDERKEREKLNQSLRNSVSGFKVARARYEATNVPSNVSSSSSMQSSSVTVQMNGDVYGQEDFERKVTDAVNKANRRNKLSSSGLART